MKRDTKIVAWFIGALPALILSTALFCTWAIAQGASARWRLIFRVLCHGMPERSLEVFGTTMPICARCTGIYAGLLAGILAFGVLPRIETAVLKVAVMVALIPIGLDGLTQAAGFRESNNPLRIVTGATVAFLFGIWALSSVEKTGERAFHTS
jgi:uncharacterized membrane protein